ncbi:predicted protein [Histoplasma capsulatum H143]|uniref:Uncharacterized protein n=1 Tax=Ajellomyces capsulatus (strain H143) TaxID=544712 RepID=C6H8M6_AJECH|nr:predicted protein [Histoplasma capsulatum H143]
MPASACAKPRRPTVIPPHQPHPPLATAPTAMTPNGCLPTRNKESSQASHWRAVMECFYSLTQPKSRLMSTTQPRDEGSQGLSLFGVVSAWLWAVLCVIPPGSRGWREYDVPFPPEIIASGYGERLDEGETEEGIANAHFQP